MTNSDSISSNKSKSAPNYSNSKRSLLLVSIFTLLFIGVLANILFIYGNRNKPEKIAETFFISSVNLDMQTLKDNSAFDLNKLIDDWTKNLMDKHNYASEEELFSKYSNSEGIKLNNIDDLINIYKIKYINNLKKSFGDNYKINFHTVECKDLSDEEIEQIKQSSIETLLKISKSSNSNKYIDFNNITDYKKVVFDATISGTKSQTNRSKMYLVKIDNNWKSLDLDLISILF